MKKRKYQKPEVVKIIVDFKQLVRNSTGCCRCTPSCPYVFVWDGKEYIMDNTILPVSLDLFRKEKVVTDHYVLQKEPQKKYGEIKLKIKELEYEVSWLKKFEMLAVEHPKDYKIGFTTDGRMLTYKAPYLPKLCLDKEKNDCLAKVTQDNWASPEDSYYANPGDSLKVEFENLNSNHLKLIIVDPRDDDWKLYATKVHESIHVNLFIDGEYREIDVLHTRNEFYPEVVDLTAYLHHLDSDPIKIKLDFTAPHKICFIGLDTSMPISVKEEKRQIIYAEHSKLGDVTDILKSDNDKLVRLYPGESIDLRFPAPSLQDRTNTSKLSYVLVSKGYYVPIRELLKLSKVEA